MKRSLVVVAAVALLLCPSAFARTIYVRNLSSVYPTTQLTADVSAIDKAFTYDFNPAWGTDVNIVQSQAPPARAWVISIVNEDANNPGALGYHDVAIGAIPYGVVLAKTTQEDQGVVSVVLAHEAFEIAVDPLVNQMARVARFYYPFYMMETADPVEALNLAYYRDGVLISDFILPNWFRAGSPGPWDFTRHTTKPLQILKGGYQIAWSRLAEKLVNICYGGVQCL